MHLQLAVSKGIFAQHFDNTGKIAKKFNRSQENTENY